MAASRGSTNIPRRKFKHKDFPTYQSHLSASASSSSSNSEFRYDVFVSFRGEDTRENFTDHLYTALNGKGITAFKDDEELRKGQDISPELLRAIEESTFSLIVLSENYANSRWCLDELLHILECMKPRKSVIPIFYRVDPYVVRHQTESYERAFVDHKDKFKRDEDKIERWRFALTSVGSLSGWHLKEGRESEFIQNIVETISRRLNEAPEEIITNPNVTSDGISGETELVGMGSRAKMLIFLLDMKTEDVRMIGICGIGGIGKTTIARVVYTKLADQFDACCFLFNVRQRSEKRGLDVLQNHLLCELTRGREMFVSDGGPRIALLSEMFRDKKVLIVLDDVHEQNQLKALAGEAHWFGKGSRIIITTRDMHLLRLIGVDIMYECDALNRVEATQLFSLKTFRQDIPPCEYEEFSRHIVEYAGGNPLALAVIGSHFRGKSLNECICGLERMQNNFDGIIFRPLFAIFDQLDEESQNLFLHIACFFQGKDVDRVQRVLDCCGFHSRIGISVLIDKSLVTVTNNIVGMHSLVENMGRTIVREKCQYEPGKRSRLWDHQDINNVLNRNSGTEAVKGIVYDSPETETDQYWNCGAFSGMYNLELLIVRGNVRLSQGLEYLPEKLRFFKWRRYPLESLPTNFAATELVELNLCHSQIVELWRGKESFESLKFIKLSHCRNLIKAPDFTGVPNLESLVLEGCTNLNEAHPSLGILERLRLLNLKDCLSLRSLPSFISLQSLEICILSGCSKLENFPDVVGNMKCLSQLFMDGATTENQPNSIIEQPIGLPLLNRVCKSFANLLSCIPNVIKLSLRNCELPEGALPSDIGHLPSLEVLDVGRNNFISLPDSIRELRKLRFLGLANCNLLQLVPELPCGIEYVEARDCSSLMTFPTLPEVRTSTYLVLSFINCHELKNQGCKCMIIKWLKAYLQALLKSQTSKQKEEKSQNQEISYISGRFDIIIPGTRIPEWVRYQNMGPSVRVYLPPKWNNNNWIGFVFCVVFGVHDEIVDAGHGNHQIEGSENSQEITCRLFTNEGSLSTGFGFCISSSTNFESDHVWLRYVWNGSFRERMSQWHRITYIDASFGIESQYLEVKKCGFRAVYKQDVQDLKRKRQYIHPPTMDLGVHFFSFDT